MLSSCETVCTDALSGGNNLATALSLNACPYLATSSFRYRPSCSDSIEATTSLTQGGDGEAPEYTRFDLIIRGGKAQQRVMSLRDAVERQQKVIVAFKLGDIYPDLFTYESGERKGQPGVAIKGRLLQINATTIDGIRVDWADAGMPDETPDGIHEDGREAADVQPD